VSPFINPLMQKGAKMPPVDASRNLLFGLLALQNSFIDRDALLDAFNRWGHDKVHPLGEILVERGALAPDEFALLDALVAKHLERFNNDPQQSLAALSSIGSLREDLSRIADPEVRASLGHVSAARPGGEDDSARTLAPTTVGESTSAGTRFLILRPHATGGLGQVFVARDTELNRDVALKEIQLQFAFEPRFRSRFEFEAEVTGGLEHPGIVPVYGLGHLPDGRPFYAMRFIKGNNLKSAIERFHEAERQPARDLSLSTLELRELLGRFIDVCDAIAYAHSRGVLHRDLKPGNIMLGKYGETLVVDWGLAKSLEQCEPETPTGRSELPLKPTSGSALEPTLTGAAIGTPAYMSPEQAEGRMDLLGPRSDVYCLGATLYHLLTGRAPCKAENVADALQMVASGDIPRPRSINPRVVLALEAICLKAMALKPADRYESVQAVKSDLERWLADEPVAAYREPLPDRLGRWGRKHQTLVTSAAAVLFMAACAAGVVGAERSTHARDIERKNFDLVQANKALDAERKKAVNGEQLALDAVKRFRDAVIEEPQLKNNAALLGLRKRLLKEPLEFFRRLRERLQVDRDTRTESLVRLAEATYALGQLAYEIGDQHDALIAHAESVTTWQRLVDANPSVTEFQTNLAAGQVKIGNLLRETGQPADALKSLEAALAIQQKLAEANPSVSTFQRELAVGLNDIGILLWDTGKPADALKSYRAALTIRTKLADANPSVRGIQRELAGSHNNIGALLSQTGDPTGALNSLDAALAIQQRLADANPSLSQLQRELAASLSNIGAVLRQTGNAAKALSSHEAALAIQTKLAATNPSVSQFQSDLATSRDNIGRLLGESGRHADALKSFEAALTTRKKLAAANPSVSAFQSDLAVSHNNLGVLMRDIGRPAEAQKSHEAALAIQSKLVREQPESPHLAGDMGITLNYLAVIDMDAQRLLQARARLREAVEWQRKALTSNPAHPVYRRFMEEHLDNLVKASRTLGDFKGLAEAQQQLVEIRVTDPATAAIDARLKVILIGQQRPKDAGERLQLARRAYDIARYAAAARLWQEALDADPRLADDRQAQHRYNAACAAALAGCGQGKDDPRPSSVQKTELRQQALNWLTADLGTCTKLLGTATQEQHRVIVGMLEHWKQDSDLAGIRVDSELAKLAETERAAFRKLWADVDVLLKKASQL
jgi:serine/threonine-protein kinase